MKRVGILGSRCCGKAEDRGKSLMSIGCKQYVGERTDPDSTSKVISWLLDDAYLFEFQQDYGALKFGDVG